MPDLDKARLDWIDQNHYSRGQTVDVVEEDEAGKGYPSCKFSCDREGSWHEPDCNPPVKLLILLIDALCAHPTCGSGHRKIYSRNEFAGHITSFARSRASSTSRRGVLWVFWQIQSLAIPGGSINHAVQRSTPRVQWAQPENSRRRWSTTDTTGRDTDGRFHQPADNAGHQSGRCRQSEFPARSTTAASGADRAAAGANPNQRWHSSARSAPQ